MDEAGERARARAMASGHSAAERTTRRGAQELRNALNALGATAGLAFRKAALLGAGPYVVAGHP